MKIVVLDGYAMNPGDVSWEELQQICETKIYDRTSPDKVLSCIGDAEIALTNKAVIDGETIRKAPNLKYIGVMATGYNVVDINAACEKGVKVTNVPAYSTVSVAQLTFALILECVNHTSAYGDSVKNGDWVGSKDFSYQVAPQMELHGKTLALIGLGQIGQTVARIGLAFGMKVIASHRHPERDAMEGVTFVSEEDCFKNADILSLHCPLNDSNKAFVNKDRLCLMKPSAWLINTSRGPLIHESDLADALNSVQIAGAALDVLSTEPPAKDNPLLKAKNCLITPHIAWATYEARSRLMNVVVDNIKNWMAAQPENLIV